MDASGSGIKTLRDRAATLRNTRLVFQVRLGLSLTRGANTQAAKGGMMRHRSIIWFAVYGSLIMLIFLVSGVTWCISPMSFVKAHRILFPRNPVSNTAKWELAVCSISGRLVGAMFVGFAGFMFYQLWSRELR